MKKLIDIGIVSAIYPERASAKVRFEDVDMISRELPIMVNGAEHNKQYWMPKVGEMVICLFLENSTKGFIAGSWYSDDDEKPANDENKQVIQFQNGTKIVADTKANTIEVSGNKPLNITLNLPVVINDTSLKITNLSVDTMSVNSLSVNSLSVAGG